MCVLKRCLILCVCCLMLGMLPMAVAAEEISAEPVSLGLRNLAAMTDMVVSGKSGELYYFSEADFLRAMNLSSIEYITVISAPSATEGTLFLGASAVQSGQVISAGNLEQLTYVSATVDSGVGAFTFSVDGSGYGIECRVYGLRDTGAAPTLAYAPEASLSVSTYCDLSLSDALSGYDPDGDSLVYEIVSAPEHGAVRILDREAGTYRYTPYAGYAGEDSFRYVVRDTHGNYSKSREVCLDITAPSVSVEFSDLSDDRIVGAALAMAEHNIMSGTRVGGEVFFYPDETVSRVDFLVMAMHAIGINEVPEADSTVFRDDEKIPDSLRGYVAAAYADGIVHGVFGTDGLYFQPDRAVTRAEAAKILSGLIEGCAAVSAEAKTPAAVAVSAVRFDDMGAIPAWAEEPLRHLSALGIFSTDDGKADATAALTRRDAAMMLASLLRIVET